MLRYRGDGSPIPPMMPIKVGGGRKIHRGRKGVCKCQQTGGRMTQYIPLPHALAASADCFCLRCWPTLLSQQSIKELYADEQSYREEVRGKQPGADGGVNAEASAV